MKNDIGLQTRVVSGSNLHEIIVVCVRNPLSYSSDYRLY